jgi:hypothetical protein
MKKIAVFIGAMLIVGSAAAADHSVKLCRQAGIVDLDTGKAITIVDGQLLANLDIGVSATLLGNVVIPAKASCATGKVARSGSSGHDLKKGDRLRWAGVSSGGNHEPNLDVTVLN